MMPVRNRQDWCMPGFDDKRWEQAALRKAPEGMLSAHMASPDRVMEVLKPVKIESSVMAIIKLISDRKFQDGCI